MRSHLLGAALIASSFNMAAFAEPPVQAGETRESLSKAKITTTVNGQPGSLADLVNSGKVQVISGQSAPVQTQLVNPQDAQMADSQGVTLPSARAIDPNAPAQATPESIHPEQPAMQIAPADTQDQNLNAVPEQSVIAPETQ